MTPPPSATIEKNSLAIGMWGNLLMGIAGVIAAYASRSDALLVDGLYSGANFISAIIAGKISMIVTRAPDRRYPFGYDAYEVLYVKYRSMVLLGILGFAVFSAGSKIFLYVSGGSVPELVFGPILIYMVLMVLICVGLAVLHHRNWIRTGKRSELLKAESRAAVVDGVISAGSGGGLLAASLLHGTVLESVIPVADSIVVIVMCVFIIGQPVQMFRQALREVAGGSADKEVVNKVTGHTQQFLEEHPYSLIEVAVMKMGRSYLIVAYVTPEGDVLAKNVDILRRNLETSYNELLGGAKAELIITEESPFDEESVQEPDDNAAKSTS